MNNEIIQIIDQPQKDQWASIFARPKPMKNIKDAVQIILDDVKVNGDGALLKLTERFDGVKIDSLIVEVSKNIDCNDELKAAIDQAMANIRTYHKAQLTDNISIETMDGIDCRQIKRPIAKVGLYIPGGTAPLISTLMMLGIPAEICGCSEIVVCTPPNKNGEVHPALHYIADKLNIEKIYQVGGAQAIAAMAYGTETIPKVSKIFGPGNSFVTLAKELIQSEGIAIDMPAGPSELMVIADDSSIPTFVASDLLSQAEHGKDSQVICIASTSDIALKIQLEIINQVAKLPRKEIAEEALKHSTIIIEPTVQKQIDLVNAYAPEHLILATEDQDEIIEKVYNAGSIFLGNWSAEAIGDYAAGPNHTLPTNGHAKAYSGVNVDTFMKKISVQRVSKQGFKKIAETVEILAEAENLIGHKRAVSIRKKYLTND